MKNLKDAKTTIYPSTTRGGKELPSSSALDSPSVLSKLATPKPASAIRSDMSHVIDDATSAMHDTYDETTSMLDTTVPLGEFLDEQLARVRENEIIETDIIKHRSSFIISIMQSRSGIINNMQHIRMNSRCGCHKFTQNRR